VRGVRKRSMRQLLTLKQARDILQMSDTKIRELIYSDPSFPAYHIGGRWKIDARELDEWIDARRNGVILARKAAPSKRGRPPKETTKRVYNVITPGWDPHKGRQVAN